MAGRRNMPDEQVVFPARFHIIRWRNQPRAVRQRVKEHAVNREIALSDRTSSRDPVLEAVTLGPYPDRR